MYGEIFYYNLDGSLKTTTLEQFKSKHCNCCHEIRNVQGLNIEVQQVRSMVENYVFIECCDEKYFFNLFNAKVNLKERLVNFQKMESLKIHSMISKDVIRKMNHISYAKNIVRQIEEQEQWGNQT